MEIRKFSTYCNTYVLLTESSAVVIDPFEFTPEINSLLNHSGIQHRAVVLTHGHFDHIKDAALVREKTGAKILIHKCDEECLLYPHFTLCALFGQTLNPFSPDETFEDFGKINRLWRYDYTDERKAELYSMFTTRGGDLNATNLPAEPDSKFEM